jgi:hypothetical protein
MSTRDDPRFTEHLARAAEAFMREMRGLIPDDIARRARGSLRDALLAARSVIDSGIERLKDDEDVER